MKTKNETMDLSEVLGEQQQDSESEGAIQTVCGFDTEIHILGGEIREGQNGKYALIDLNDSQGTKHKVHSSAKPIVDDMEKLIKSESFGKIPIVCKVVKGISKSTGRTFYTLVGLKE
tara:strand:+ start:36 stop:386 length:351 start_codon:yes stop_codon:yes gene_type:complete